MEANHNNVLLKQISKSQDSDRSSSYKFSMPGLDKLKKLMGKASKKQVVDLALFSAGIYVMYVFGKKVADSIDDQMPTEKSVMDMMKQVPNGGMPSPM